MQHALPGSVVPGRLDQRMRDRIVADTAQNSTALLELPAIDRRGWPVGSVAAKCRRS